MFEYQDDGMLKIFLQHEIKKTLGFRRSSVSAEGIEYHPPCGDAQQKILHQEDYSVSAEGIEPSTNGLKGRCSTIELRARYL